VISVVPTYRRTGSALHAARPSVAIAFCAACCVPAVVFDNPIVVLASIGAATGVALAAKVVITSKGTLEYEWREPSAFVPVVGKASNTLTG